MNGPPERAKAIAGAILSCAVGDALGLPYEGVSKRRAARLLGPPDRHRFLLGRGMVSDDTEHTCMVAQALCRFPNDPDAFARDLARRLRWWLLGAPAGIGSATLRATVKLWLGYSPANSGVFSAGNSPAMRSAILGAAIDDVDTLHCYVHAATRITHTDPKAEYGAFAVAFAAWCARRGLDTVGTFFEQYRRTAGATSAEFAELMTAVESSVNAGESTEQFAERIGCGRGVSGYTFHTVPVVLHAWLGNPRDYRRAVSGIIACGGDADTTAAIAGAIVGSAVGRAGVPDDWIAGVCEWPRTVTWMSRLAKVTAKTMATQEAVRPPRTIPGIGWIRNLFFLGVVLLHIGRRVFPPY